MYLLYLVFGLNNPILPLFYILKSYKIVVLFKTIHVRNFRFYQWIMKCGCYQMKYKQNINL